MKKKYNKLLSENCFLLKSNNEMIVCSVCILYSQANSSVIPTVWRNSSRNIQFGEHRSVIVYTVFFITFLSLAPHIFKFATPAQLMCVRALIEALFLFLGHNHSLTTTQTGEKHVAWHRHTILISMCFTERYKRTHRNTPIYSSVRLLVHSLINILCG